MRRTQNHSVTRIGSAVGEEAGRISVDMAAPALCWRTNPIFGNRLIAKQENPIGCVATHSLCLELGVHAYTHGEPGSLLDVRGMSISKRIGARIIRDSRPM